mgnify:CR=1 FL=1
MHVYRFESIAIKGSASSLKLSKQSLMINMYAITDKLIFFSDNIVVVNIVVDQQAKFIFSPKEQISSKNYN